MGFTKEFRMPKKEAKGKEKPVKGKEKAKDIKKPIRLPGDSKKSSKGKKKWSKSKVKEKAMNATFFTKELYEKMLTEIPKMKLITISSVSDKLKMGGNCARQAITELARLQKIIQVGEHHKGYTIYTKGPQQTPSFFAQSHNHHTHDYRLPKNCLLYTSPSPRDATLSRMPSSA
eukprot:TRINITY_DN3549_c0_g3_i2.p1 TRINITY_DN3549_c0_g3~~TRINITY_DN3549_c0_g3_i2.p1  ORF type:complete len:186 (-),score=59.47 TRINITY_DN3549_c0_g3_i2:17-538(-)